MPFISSFANWLCGAFACTFTAEKPEPYDLYHCHCRGGPSGNHCSGGDPDSPGSGKSEEQEAERFGFYYVQALAEEIGNPIIHGVEEEGFYDSKAYYSLRNQLCRFVGLEDISQVFTDICVVRSKDHQILASASGFNGQEFESVYMAGTRNLLDTLTAGGRRPVCLWA